MLTILPVIEKMEKHDKKKGPNISVEFLSLSLVFFLKLRNIFGRKRINPYIILHLHFCMLSCFVVCFGNLVKPISSNSNNSGLHTFAPFLEHMNAVPLLGFG